MSVGVNVMKSMFGNRYRNRRNSNVDRSLTRARVNRNYVIKEIATGDDEIKNFLFSLGCYEGEDISVISILADNYIVSVKGTRYSIDRELASVIII
jgi:ferrous iron transport protein A